MDRTFQALASRSLGEGAGFHRPVQRGAARVTLESPALEVMTDLMRTGPATVRPQAPVDAANQYMIMRGVRLLLVVENYDSVLGLISATDILGEKVVRVATERGVPHSEVTVADIMTPADRVEVMPLADIESAKVGHIVATLKRAGRQHALAVDFDPDSGRPMVRGIFSISQIARQLGVQLQTSEVARSFAEIELALSH
jgi:CBS domain-containing protein